MHVYYTVCFPFIWVIGKLRMPLHTSHQISLECSMGYARCITNFICLVALFAALPASSAWGQSASISGSVTDAADDSPLVGANVVVLGTGFGAATDAEGRYLVANLPPGTYTIRISFTGFETEQFEIQLGSDENYTLDAALIAGIDLDPIQVTAGRRQEQVLDAPASISVVVARDIEAEVQQTTVKALRNVAALDIVQTGVDRHEVVLRGFNNVFSGATHVLTDYRDSGAATIGVNLHSIMPAMPIDVERVEIVRGPGSALYGAGVNSGVIHYITKDAFQYPGATVSVSGGQRSSMNIQGRVAGTLGSKLGVKLTGSYGRANDFELENCDPALLTAQLFDQCPDPEDAVQIFVDGVRDNEFRKFTANGNIEWRIGPQTSLTLNGGLSGLDGTVLSGIGTLQGRGYQYRFGQVRFSSGPFFAQAYVNSNDTGDTFVYGGDPVVEFSDDYTVQAQYDLHIGSWEELILGVDFRLDRPDTRGTVLGRNEDRDNIDEYGAYAQSSTKITDKLELTLALRADYNNVVSEVQLSPRLGLVVKPATGSSFRATYNRSYSSPSATQYYLDLVAATLPGGIKVRGRGAATGFTYERNPAFAALGAPSDLVASSLLPGAEGLPAPIGVDTGTIYALMYEGLAAIPNETLSALLAQVGLNVPAVLVGRLKEGLSPANTVVQGFSPGVLGALNLSTLSVTAGPPDLADVDPIQPTISQTYELGYKGIINDRVLVAVDAYYATRENFVGALQTRTPFVLVPTLNQDLARDIATGITNNATLAGALGLFGLTPEQGAQLLVDLAGGDLPSASTPIAIVQPRENNPGIGQVPELMLTYPNFGSIEYYGADLSLQVLASERLSLFGNFSWVSDDFFDHTEVGEESEELELALNAPGFKVKLGGQYRHRSGFSFNASGRYTNGFPVISGPYIGEVDSYFLMDASVGYVFDNSGLRVDLGINNLFDSNHREFVGAPKLGRLASARLTYTTDWAL